MRSGHLEGARAEGVLPDGLLTGWLLTLFVAVAVLVTVLAVLR
jgi:hypothetical protein